MRSIPFCFALAVVVGFTNPAIGQDTLKGVSVNSGLIQFCGTGDVIVSESENSSYEVMADAQVVTKSETAITLKPGFKARGLTNNGFFLAKIVNACGEMVWAGSESNDWGNPANWESFGVPSENDAVLIPSTANDPVYQGTDGVKNLTLQGGDLMLNADLEISESLNLSSGIIKSDQNVLVLQDGITVTGGSTNSYVQGQVSKAGSSAFTFPIGDKGFYRPISLEQPSASGVYQAVYHESNSDDLYSHSQKATGIGEISTTGYWEFRKASGPDVSVSLNYDPLHSCGITNTNDVDVVVWDGTQWVSQGISTLTGDDFNASFSSTTFTNYGPLSLAVSEAAPEITLNLINDRSVLYSQVINLADTPIVVGGQSPYDYRWYLNGNLWGTQEMPYTPLYYGGDYELVVRDYKGCVGQDVVAIDLEPSLKIDFSGLANSLVNDELHLRVTSDQFDEVITGKDGIASFNYDLNTPNGAISIKLSSEVVTEESEFSFNVNSSGEISDLAFVDVDDLGTTTENIALSSRFYNAKPGQITFFLDGEPEQMPDDSPLLMGSTLYQGVLMTANGDGKNDVFQLIWKSVPSYYSLEITDRQGVSVFQTNDISESWDGLSGGVLVDEGGYLYSVTYETEVFDGQFILKH